MLQRRRQARVVVDAAGWVALEAVPADGLLTVRIRLDDGRAMAVEIPERRCRRARALIQAAGAENCAVWLTGHPTRAGKLANSHVTVVRVRRKATPAGT
jgi:hypothetical protein